VFNNPPRAGSRKGAGELVDTHALPAPAAAISARDRALQQLDALIDDWFGQHWHNTPLSQSTQLYNLAHAAKQDLKARIRNSVR
jgi:hypothetical protein